MNSKNIVLVGFMGTGKTTVGRILARRLERELVDTDEWIEQHSGRVISEIFETDGEAFFRGLEREAVCALAGKTDLIITGGGGIVLDPENVADFQRGGLLVCLKADPDEVLRRVEAQSHRPLLEQGDKRDRILKLLETRKPVYDAIACSVDTTGLDEEQVADAVMEQFQA